MINHITHTARIINVFPRLVWGSKVSCLRSRVLQFSILFSSIKMWEKEKLLIFSNQICLCLYQFDFIIYYHYYHYYYYYYYYLLIENVFPQTVRSGKRFVQETSTLYKLTCFCGRCNAEKLRIGLMAWCCEFDTRLRRNFFPTYFRPSPLPKHMRKVVGGYRKKFVLVLVGES